MNDSPEIMELKITGMDCADCAKTLERGVGGLADVRACRVNFMSGKMEIEGSAALDAITRRIESLGYGVAEDADEPPIPTIQEDASGVGGFVRFMLKRTQTAVVMFSLLVLLLSFALSLLNAPDLLIKGLQLGIVLAAGVPIMRGGIRQLIFSRGITINFLMSIATVGALTIGEWSEAATVIVLFAIGEALESYSADRARGALHSLMMLAPQEAVVLRPCMDCQEHMGRDGYIGGACPWCGTHEQQIPVSQVALGENILIRPGSRIPLDGVVTEGESAVDQSPITGESVPVQKTPGDSVFAGSVNGHAALHVEVTSTAQDNTLSRIIRLVEAAQAQKAPSERFVDRFARIYTPLVVVLALLVAVVPPLLLGGVFDTWLYRALALLVVACPCALVISTPVTVVSAMVQAAKQGILIKGGAYLEMLGSIKVFAFDKTGTLTFGKPQVVIVQSVDCQSAHPSSCPPCDEMLALASAVERQSEHPLGQAVVREAQQRGMLDVHAPAQAVTALAGRGIQGQVNGHVVTIGSHRYFDEHYPHSPAICDDAAASEKRGQSVMMVADSDAVLGFISVADTLRPAAESALRDLKNAHKVMLTGDNAEVAASIAAQVGMDSVKADLMPGEKASIVQDLVREHGSVAMIGDGINDAPALAAATVGIAMGGAGTAQAMETADVVLMQDDLSQLPNAVEISRRAARIIKQNIGLSLAIKALFVALTLPGLTTLWMAVFADVGMSLLVTFNGMRMLRGAK